MLRLRSVIYMGYAHIDYFIIAYPEEKAYHKIY